MQKQHLFFVAKLTVTLLAIWLISQHVDTASFWNQLKATNLIFFLCAFLIFLSQVFIVAWRWRNLVQVIVGEQSPLPEHGAFQRIMFHAQFIGQALPFLANDAIRIAGLTERGISLGNAFRSTILDRAFALTILFMILLPSLLLVPAILEPVKDIVPLIQLFVSASLIGLGVTLLVSDKIVRWVSDWRAAKALADILVSMRTLFFRTAKGLPIPVLFILVHMMSIAGFWTLAQGQSLPISFLDAATIVPLILVATMLPISIAGWGVREGIVVSILAANGIPAEAALLLSLSFGMVILLASLPGAVTLFLSQPRPPIENKSI